MVSDRPDRDGGRATGMLGRLRRDRAGNTLAMMAIALVPVSALAGSAVDMARLYVVKVRLQQACDAGVLAGRKFMADSTSTTLDTNATNQARTFFTNNFREGWMRTAGVSFTPSKTSDNQVSGTATATVPMTVMKMFKAADQTLNVTCEARYDLADTDIMFVLDTTGSMACAPGTDPCATDKKTAKKAGTNENFYYVEEQPDSKLSALRQAVIDFDTTIKSNADPSTHIRYGFVTYSSAVNVGKLLQPSMLVTSWTYQSRRLIGETSNGGWYDTVLPSYVTSANCASMNRRWPGTDPLVREGWFADSTATYVRNATWSYGACRAQRQDYRPRWRYEPVTQDVAQFVAGNEVIDPTRLDNARKSQWNGCIEERQTAVQSSFDIDNLPPDLDPDLIPNSNATRWKPHWPDVTWQRSNTSYEDNDDTDAARSNDNNGRPYGESYLQSLGYAACGVPARRLKEMTSSEVANYVNQPEFKPLGGTYHDVGMIWGTRMLSPNGVFANDTAAWPGRNTPTRHIIFMTDGQMAPNPLIYGQYGIERFDGRVTNVKNTSNSLLEPYHTARFRAVCDYARDRLNMTVWVVALGTDLTSDLTACATPGDHAFKASSKAELQAAFKKIAAQVAMLRVSK